MANFSITDAATEGFRLARREPTVLVVWAGVGLLMLIATAATFYLIGGAHLQTVVATLQSGTVTEPDAMYALYQPLFPAYGAAIALSLLAYSVLLPAAYRAILQPQTRSPGYLKLGMAELRQLALIIVILGLVVGIDVAGGQLLKLLISAGVSAAIVSLFGSVAIFALLIVVTVRLSLTGPDTLVRERLSLIGSWRLSKGAFGPMFATYALTFLFQVMIFGASIVVMAIVLGGSTAALSMGVVGAIIAMVLSVFYLVVVSLIYALSIAVMAAPTARIYRVLAPAEPVQP